MAYSECVVCDKCGKHATLLPATFLAAQHNAWLNRTPVGWFVYRNHANETIDMEFTFYCSKLCVQQGV